MTSRKTFKCHSNIPKRMVRTTFKCHYSCHDNIVTPTGRIRTTFVFLRYFAQVLIGYLFLMECRSRWNIRSFYRPIPKRKSPSNFATSICGSLVLRCQVNDNVLQLGKPRLGPYKQTKHEPNAETSLACLKVLEDVGSSNRGREKIRASSWLASRSKINQCFEGRVLPQIT